MKQQEQKNITNPMSKKRKKKRSSGDGIGVPLLVGIPVIIFMLAVFGYMYNIEYTIKKDPHAFVGGAPVKTTATSDGSKIRLKDTTISNTNQQLTREEDPDDDEAAASKEVEEEDTIVVLTKHGNIRITLRPDLSSESVAYVKQIATQGCEGCRFHRSEKDLLVQGVMKNHNVPLNKVFGSCPDPNYVPKNKCPDHDPHCGCHGPIMTKGMVGWAGGTAGGPDWFLNIFHKPVDWWEHQHTVWGELQLEEDAGTLQTIQTIQALPVTKRGVMWTLDETIDFTIKLE